MSPPQRTINNFVPVSSKETIDTISRNFILLQVICGLFRLPVLGIARKIHLGVMLVLTVLYNIAIIYNICSSVSFSAYKMAPIFDTIEFVSCTLLGFASCKKILKFYKEINMIDKDLNFCHKSQLKEQLFIHFVQLITIGIIFVISWSGFPECRCIFIQMIYIIPLKLLHYLELNYYGYLFLIVIPRLTLLKNILKKSCNTKKSHTKEKYKKINRTLPCCDIVLLMDCYNRFLKTYEYLNEAIKWQILIIIISIFNVSLSLSHQIAKQYLSRGEEEETENTKLCIDIPLLVIEVMPFIVPCLLASQVSVEVVHLKEIITSSVYENKLDKSNRYIARAFLELLHTQPLHFPLLHFFDVDFTLPFKLFSLILTYLIILLQFDKVLNINKVF